MTTCHALGAHILAAGSLLTAKQHFDLALSLVHAILHEDENDEDGEPTPSRRK